MKTGYSVVVEVTTRHKHRIVLYREDIIRAAREQLDRVIPDDVDMTVAGDRGSYDVDIRGHTQYRDGEPVVIEWETVETARDEEMDDVDTE